MLGFSDNLDRVAAYCIWQYSDCVAITVFSTPVRHGQDKTKQSTKELASGHATAPVVGVTDGQGPPRKPPFLSSASTCEHVNV